MRIVLLTLLVACAPDEPTIAPVDASATPDASRPIALTPGGYILIWTCQDGCGPLLFPPAAYSRLDVQSGLLLRWYTAGADNELTVSGDVVDDCAVSGPLVYSEGNTGEVSFCPEFDGPEADVTYTAEFGAMPMRTYRVKALPVE